MSTLYILNHPTNRRPTRRTEIQSRSPPKRGENVN